MKIKVLFIVAILAMASLAFAQTKVSRIAVTSEIVDKEPVDSLDSIKSDVERIFCFTEIQTDQYPTEISHVWIYEKNIEAEVKLFVGSPKWRTFSSKAISPEKVGNWIVEVYAQDGKLIDTVDFEANE